jgi:CRP/FNR family transcriptional regulator
MLASSNLERPAACRGGAEARRRERCRGSETEPRGLLATGDVLFRKGDARGRLYRVERGALCHYMQWGDGRHEVIEFAFPGDIIGFGPLDRHISAAQAMVETEVSTVAPCDFEEALETDGRLWARHAGATDREFAYRRAEAIGAGEDRPAARVASLLVALAHMSAREGHDPVLSAGEIASITASGQPGMSADCVSSALAELERRGLITRSEAGLRIADVDALEACADGR